MPRVLKKRTEQSNPPGYSWKLRRYAIASTALIEFKSDSAVWKSVRKGVPSFAHVTRLKGAIVKVTPPADIPDGTLEVLERELYEAGALTVRVMPAQHSDKTIAKKAAKEAPEPDAPRRSLRQVAVDRAKRVVTSADVDALVALVNQAMDVGECI